MDVADGPSLHDILTIDRPFYFFISELAKTTAEKNTFAKKHEIKNIIMMGKIYVPR